MNFAKNLQTLFKTQGPARTAMIVMLVMWVMAAVWGWFLVGPTVLRESQAARDYVNFATKIFPWLNNVRKLGPQAEKGLFLHCVYTVALAPLSIACSLVFAFQPEAKEREARATLRDVLIMTVACFALLIFMIFVMYNGILQPSFGKLHRTGYSFVVSELTVPVVAPFFIAGFWHVLTGGVYFAYYSARRLISTV